MTDDKLRAAPLGADGLDARSYAFLGARVRRQYLGYYKLAFADGALDLKTKELIAFGVSLATGADNCIDGHLRKALKLGATREELEEVVEVTAGVAAASVVDEADRSHARMRGKIDAFLRETTDEATDDASRESKNEESA